MKNTRTPLDCLPAIGAAVFVAMGVFGALQLRLSPTAHATEPAAHATESAAHANGPLHDAASTVRAGELEMSPRRRNRCKHRLSVSPPTYISTSGWKSIASS